MSIFSYSLIFFRPARRPRFDTPIGRGRGRDPRAPPPRPQGPRYPPPPTRPQQPFHRPPPPQHWAHGWNIGYHNYGHNYHAPPPESYDPHAARDRQAQTYAQLYRSGWIDEGWVQQQNQATDLKEIAVNLSNAVLELQKTLIQTQNAKAGCKRPHASSHNNSAAGPSGQAAKKKSRSNAISTASSQQQAGEKAKAQDSQNNDNNSDNMDTDNAASKGKTSKFGKCHAKNQRNRRRLQRRKEEAEEAARQAEQAENPPPAQQAAGPTSAQQAAGQANVQQPASASSRPQSQNSNDSGIGSDLSISNSASKNIHDRLGVRITDRLGSEKVPEEDFDMSSHPNEGNDSVFSPVPKTALEINIDNLDKNEHSDDTHMTKPGEEDVQAAGGATPTLPQGGEGGAPTVAGTSSASEMIPKQDKQNDSDAKSLSKRSKIKQAIANKVQNKANDKDNDKAQKDKDKNSDIQPEKEKKKTENKTDNNKKHTSSKSKKKKSDKNKNKGLTDGPSTSGTRNNKSRKPDQDDEAASVASDDCLMLTDQDVKSLMKGKEGNDKSDTESDSESYLNISTEEPFFKYLQKNIPRPDKQKRQYEFTLFDKLDNPQDENFNVKCTGCESNVPFYNENDTICIIIGASTLLSRDKNLRKDREEATIGKVGNKADCTHVEFLYSRGGQFDHLRVIADPIITFLRRFFNIEILTCLGVNDMLVTHKVYSHIIDAAKRFDKALREKKKAVHDSLKGTVVIKYMTMPFIPAISQLKGETHELKNDTDRTSDFVFVNRFLDTVLNAKGPERVGIPHLHTFGISSDPLDNFFSHFQQTCFYSLGMPTSLQKRPKQKFLEDKRRYSPSCWSQNQCLEPNSLLFLC